MNLAEEIKKILEKVLDEKALTPEFVSELTVIVEAALSEKIESMKADIKKQIEEDAVNELTSFKESVIDKLDAFCEEAAKEFIGENKIQIQESYKTEILESLMTGIMEVFKERNIDVPVNDASRLEELTAENRKLSEQLATSVLEKQALKEAALMEAGKRIFNEMTLNLSENQKERMKSLLENVEFENENELSQKILTVKKHFLNEKVEPEDDEDKEEKIDNSTGKQNRLDESVKKLLKCL